MIKSISEVKDDVYKLISRIETYYDVTIEIKPKTFFNNVNDIGCAFCDEDLIYIRRDMTKNRSLFLCTTIHEVCHILCYRQDIFKLYHSSKTYKQMTKKERLIMYRTGLKAERYVDQMASNEIKIWDKRITYKHDYFNIDVVKMFKDELELYKN